MVQLTTVQQVFVVMSRMLTQSVTKVQSVFKIQFLKGREVVNTFATFMYSSIKFPNNAQV